MITRKNWIVVPHRSSSSTLRTKVRHSKSIRQNCRKVNGDCLCLMESDTLSSSNSKIELIRTEFFALVVVWIERWNSSSEWSIGDIVVCLVRLLFVWKARERFFRCRWRTNHWGNWSRAIEPTCSSSDIIVRWKHSKFNPRFARLSWDWGIQSVFQIDKVSLVQRKIVEPVGIERLVSSPRKNVVLFEWLNRLSSLTLLFDIRRMIEEIFQTKFNDLTLKSCFYRQRDEHIDLNQWDLTRRRDLLSKNKRFSRIEEGRMNRRIRVSTMKTEEIHQSSKENEILCRSFPSNPIR